MAVAFDNVLAHTGPGTVGTNDSFSYTTNSANCNVNVIVEGGDGAGAAYTVTLDSVSMTSQGNVVDGGGNRVQLFTGSAASSGSHTIVVTPGSGLSVNFENITSYTGVNSLSGGGTAQNSGTSITFTPTVSIANSWVIMGGTSRTGPHNPVPSTNVVNDRTSGGTTIGAGDSGAVSSSTAFTWNNNLTSNQNSFVFVVMEPSAGAATTHNLSLLGVGT